MSIDFRTDIVAPQAVKLGFDPKQNVFLYENQASGTGETSLFFDLETYYPDSPNGQAVPDDRLQSAVHAYYTLKNELESQGLSMDPNGDVAKEYSDVEKQQNFYGYLHTARKVFSRLLDGVDADQVFEEFSPTNDLEDDWDLYKAAYFDGTGLYMLRDFIDMPRMCANSGIFAKFRSMATPDVIKTIDLLEQPELFDEHGNYADID